MDSERGGKLLHRFPFVLRDCPEAGPQDGSAAVRLISFDDGALEGGASCRFPQSLLLEAIAQTASLLKLSGSAGPREGLLAGLSRVSFGRPPRAGDKLRVSVRIVQRHGDLIRVEGKVSEGDEVLASGEIILAMTPESSPEHVPGPGEEHSADTDGDQ